MSKSRRAFLIRTAALLPVSRIALGMDKLEASNLGVELYTVRNVITKKPSATLNAIQEIGYTEVEATYDNLDQIWPALKQTKLKTPAVHIETAIFTEGGSRLDTTLNDVKQRGFEYVVIPSAPTDKGGLDGIKRLAEMMNKSGEQAKAKGLTLCYHNHAHDWQPVDGTPALERLLNETQKDLVFLEMDIFWVSVAGHDPVAMLKQYSDRVRLIHLKDKARGVPVQYGEKVPPTAFKEVGSGSIDVPAVLSAAANTSVKHYFVEQDHTPGDPIDSLRTSYQYLSSHFNK